MIENIKLMFTSIGVGTVAFMVTYALAICKTKLKKWKSTGCKIKCLCKHEYNIETVSYCQNSILLRCEKCGKLKTIKGVTPKTIDMIFKVVEDEKQRKIRKRDC